MSWQARIATPIGKAMLKRHPERDSVERMRRRFERMTAPAPRLPEVYDILDTVTLVLAESSSLCMSCATGMYRKSDCTYTGTPRVIAFQIVQSQDQRAWGDFFLRAN